MKVVTRLQNPPRLNGRLERSVFTHVHTTSVESYLMLVWLFKGHGCHQQAFQSWPRASIKNLRNMLIYLLCSVLCNSVRTGQRAHCLGRVLVPLRLQLVKLDFVINAA